MVAVLNACRPSPLPIILVEADSAGKKTQTLVLLLSMVSCATAPQKPPSGPVSKELSFDILFVCYFISFPLQYRFSWGSLFLKRLFTKPRHGFRRRAPRTHSHIVIKYDRATLRMLLFNWSVHRHAVGRQHDQEVVLVFF